MLDNKENKDSGTSQNPEGSNGDKNIESNAWPSEDVKTADREDSGGVHESDEPITHDTSIKQEVSDDRSFTGTGDTDDSSTSATEHVSTGETDNVKSDDKSNEGDNASTSGKKTSDDGNGTSGGSSESSDNEIGVPRLDFGGKVLVAALMVFAISLSLTIMGNASQKSSTARATEDNMYSDMSSITEGISKKALSHQKDVRELVKNNPSPTENQLRKIGGWKLKLETKVDNDKTYAVVTNESPAEGKDDVVWKGELKTGGDAIVTLDTGWNRYAQGDVSDYLYTPVYNVTMKQKGDGASDTDDENLESLVSLTTGDGDYTSSLYHDVKVKSQKSDNSSNDNKDSGGTMNG